MIVKSFDEELHDLNNAINLFSTLAYNSGEPYCHDINGHLYPNRAYIKTYLSKPIFCNEESFIVRGGRGNKILYNSTEPDDLDRIMLSLKEKRNKSSFSCLCCGRPMSTGVRRCPDCGCYFPELYEKFEFSENF